MRTWFTTYDRCPECGVRYEREPGFFLGSIYFNYGLTTLIVAIAFPLLLFNGLADSQTLLYVALAFVVIFPLIFFPFARSLWVGHDQFWDPRTDVKERLP